MSIRNTILHQGKRKVCRIFDTGPDTAWDRYTVAFRGYRLDGYGMVYPYISASASPHAGTNDIIFTDNAGAVNALMV